MYNTISRTFSSAKGELRLVNVSAGRGGKSYMAWQKLPQNWKNFAVGSIRKEKHCAKANRSSIRF
ncbi:hypothetical protein [Treponema denticola]|uniref:hypothetical protein n=1 Tax=Treponema denticola TaxID=158 RepID=UPI002104E40E|nr:hypothetical protein [Treponema denticola]